MNYYIETYGCQMNEYDSLITESLLDQSKAVKVALPEEADLILINTCSVRENAHQKIFNRLQSIAHLQKKGAKIGILGCMAQSLGDDLLDKNLPLNFVVGPDSLRTLVKSMESDRDSKEKSIHIKLSKTETYEDIIPTIDHHQGIKKDILSAHVAIQRGCDKFCSFCIVPFTRGRERSRAPESVIKEINLLVENGIKSIVLLGQNVNSYHHENTSFTSLVQMILEQTPLERIYYTSPHPKDFPLELIKLTAENQRVGTQIHIPLQSGSDRMLEKMKREYTSAEFLQLVKNFRSSIENLSISTDVIVGFCGESDEDYQQTLDVMEEAQFDSAYMFAYSPRPHTYAWNHYSDDIAPEIKSQRLQKLIDLQHQRALAINEAYRGKSFEVMIETISRKDSHSLQSVMRNGKKVIVPVAENIPVVMDRLLGKRFIVEITGATSHSLRGTGSIDHLM